jgi:hypothetical protein
MKIGAALPVLAGLALAAPALAAPVPITFTRITSNSPTDVASQFLAVADEGAGNTVTFTFTNTAVVPSNIAEIYFDDNNLLSFNSFVTQTGTNYALGGTPPNLPGGNSITPAFSANTALTVSANPGPPANGINAATDVLTVSYNLLNGATFTDLVDALNSGDLRLGLHVRSIGENEDSDSFVSEVVIPLPTTAGLAGLGLAGLAVRRRR